MHPDDDVEATVGRRGRVPMLVAVRDAIKRRPVGGVAWSLDAAGRRVVAGQVAMERSRPERREPVPEGVISADASAAPIASVCRSSAPTAPGAKLDLGGGVEVIR